MATLIALGFASGPRAASVRICVRGFGQAPLAMSVILGRPQNCSADIDFGDGGLGHFMRWARGLWEVPAFLRFLGHRRESFHVVGQEESRSRVFSRVLGVFAIRPRCAICASRARRARLLASGAAHLHLVVLLRSVRACCALRASLDLCAPSSGAVRVCRAHGALLLRVARVCHAWCLSLWFERARCCWCAFFLES